MRRVVPILIGLIIVGSIVSGSKSYLRAEPVWVSLAWLGFALLLGILFRVTTTASRRHYRPLLVWYALAVFVAGLEHDPPDESVLFLDAEANYGDLMVDLYPDSWEADFNQGYQAGLCFHLKESPPQYCRRFKFNDLNEARNHLEKAVESRPKADENLLYLYLYVLVHTNADPAKIEAAAAAWHFNYPFSDKPDPRLEP